MKQIKRKRISEYLNSQFEEIVNNYVDEDLIKERAGLKPFLYYNGPRNTRTRFLPEFYTLTAMDIPYKKTSHLIDLPQFVKSPYYSCVIYISPEYLPSLSERIGYSINVASKLRKKENYYNIFKLNHYGEPRNVHDIPFVLIDKNAYSKEELRYKLDILQKNHHASASYIPVIREVDGKKREFLELNFNLSNLYFSFENLDFDKFKKSVYYSIMRLFPDFEYITLVQADGQDIALSKSISKTVYSAKNKNLITKYEHSLLDYVKSKEIECVPLSTQEIQAICSKNDSPNKIAKPTTVRKTNNYSTLENSEYITVDDEYYRTMLYYLYKGPKRLGLSIEDSISKQFDASVARVPIKTPEGNYSKISVAINRNQEHEFASKLPIMCDFWSRAGIDKNNQNILYKNYYGELCDPHCTPFALVNSNFDSPEVSELLEELSKRYKFSYNATPTKRVVNNNLEELSEISVDWFANQDTAKRYLSNFENTKTILNNLDIISRAKSIQYELDYYPVYANGQLK